MKVIPVVYDLRRGCGYRKPGGLYLIAPPGGQLCCRLPISLTICPTCGGGIKPARGWTWLDVNKLFFPDGMVGPCIAIHPPGTIITDAVARPHCPLSVPGIINRAGLIWVGEKFYPHPADFMAEVAVQGFSRRIPHLPKEFKLGETWVFLAHRKAMADADGPIPGVFLVFMPTEVQYVVRGDETDEALERLKRRGVSPVHVIKLADNQDVA